MLLLKHAKMVVGLIVGVIAVVWVTHYATTWRVKARNSNFNVDIENFFSGLQKYKEHVGSYPQGNNAEIVKALLGQNPKKLIIAVGRKQDLNEKGELVDPWGTPLRIYFSGDSVLVRSAGANRRFEDSTSPENDDFIRSN